MRTLCSSVLVFEAIVVGLAIAPARALTDHPSGQLIWGGLTIVVLCLVAAALLRTSIGYMLGSVVQLVVIVSGFVLPVMFFLGALFTLLWVVALLLPRRADRIRAGR
jgi:Protein of unknown function (DUF4233)